MEHQRSTIERLIESEVVRRNDALLNISRYVDEKRQQLVVMTRSGLFVITQLADGECDVLPMHLVQEMDDD
ncbi:MAG: hypothetical protein V3S69_00175 [Dehalococcoidales bacterium]